MCFHYFLFFFLRQISFTLFSFIQNSFFFYYYYLSFETVIFVLKNGNVFSRNIYFHSVISLLFFYSRFLFSCGKVMLFRHEIQNVFPSNFYTRTFKKIFGMKRIPLSKIKKNKYLINASVRLKVLQRKREM